MKVELGGRGGGGGGGGGDWKRGTFKDTMGLSLELYRGCDEASVTQTGSTDESETFTEVPQADGLTRLW